MTVTAVFEKVNFTVAYAVEGNGSIKGKADQTIAYGENSTAVTAVPDEGYEFVAWSDGVDTATRQENNVQQNIVLTAIFRKKVLQVSYTTDGNGTIEGEASQSVEYGESATSVTAVPDYGYEFAGWSDGVKTATRTDTAINNRISVTAVFQKKIYQVRYEVANVLYGQLYEDGGKYNVTLTYQVAYGESAPGVVAVPLNNLSGQAFSFLYWSDGATAAARQDDNISSDMTVTAYFGYKIEYKVDENVGGRIEGNAEQKLLPDGKTEQVTAVPDEGYAFCGWSDLSWEASRGGDAVSELYHRAYYAVWEYIAYFEPIEKTFEYDYGIAGGTPLESEITLNRNDINGAEFVVPECAGYTFCGWYADSDYRVRITTESGRYIYGYAVFSLESDTLYARWQKDGEETNNHKILMIFVDELQATLYSKKEKNTLMLITR